MRRPRAARAQATSVTLTAGQTTTINLCLAKRGRSRPILDSDNQTPLVDRERWNGRLRACSVLTGGHV